MNLIETELSQALTAGCQMVKFFPAAAGGVKMIKNLLGAFRFTGVKFMPTGGKNLSNVADYLAVPEIVCCGGTWIVPKDALASGDWAAETIASSAALGGTSRCSSRSSSRRSSSRTSSAATRTR